MIDEKLAGIRDRKADEDHEDYGLYVAWVTKQAAIQAGAVREALDLIESAGVTFPQLFVFPWSERVDLTWDCSDRESFRAVVKALGSTIDNPWRKHTDTGNYKLTRTEGLVDLEVRATWGTCVQVQVGTEVTTKEEVVQPAVTRKVVSEEPVYEWQCPDTVLLEQLDAAADESVTAEIGAGS